MKEFIVYEPQLNGQDDGATGEVDVSVAERLVAEEFVAGYAIPERPRRNVTVGLAYKKATQVGLPIENIDRIHDVPEQDWVMREAEAARLEQEQLAAQGIFRDPRKVQREQPHLVSEDGITYFGRVYIGGQMFLPWDKVPTSRVYYRNELEELRKAGK